MGLSTSSVTRVSTGNISLRRVHHITFLETTGTAVASFTVRADASNGRVICKRTLLANESDDSDYANPEKASDDTTPLFHLTVDSGAVSVTCTGEV